MSRWTLGMTLAVCVVGVRANGQQVAYTSFGTLTSLPASSGQYQFSSTDTADARLGWQFVPTLSGNVSEVDAVVENPRSGSVPVTIELYADAGNVPGALLGSLTANVPSVFAVPIPQTAFFDSGSIPVIAGQSYWAVMSRPADEPIGWHSLDGSPSGVQVTRGSLNSGGDPNVWEVYTQPNFFPSSAFRVIVPSPGVAVWIGAGAWLIAPRRQRSVR